MLVILAATQIGSAVLESPTNDEPIHLTAGYVYLTTGKYSMDLTHPPLGRILAALPLLALPLKHIPAENAWLEFKNLIWRNRIPADSIMIRARLVIIALTLLFGAWLAWWTRRHFGSSASLASPLDASVPSRGSGGRDYCCREFNLADASRIPPGIVG